MNALEILDRAFKGDMRATGRLLTLLEELTQENAWVVERLAQAGGRAHIIGFTGMPGAGKSSLISRTIRALRDIGYRVAVISIDPTSPFSSGSVMGDRLRMQEHATDPGVFIRSVSSRGVLGGVSLAALSIIEAFDALGYDKIIVETVGVGQGETDIMHVADTIVVITMPGAGDEVQALKAGVLEIGDIYVVNKSDRPDAQKTFEHILFVAERGEIGRKSGWKPLVARTSATLGMGIRELVSMIEAHYKYMVESGEKERRLVERRKHLMRLMASRMLLEALEHTIRDEASRLDDIAKKMNGFYEESLRLVRLTGDRVKKI